MSDNAARIYGSMDWTDQGGSPYLVPGEKLRILDPYVEPGSPCPHCGHSDRMSWRFDKTSRCMIAECRWCGYYKEKFMGAVMPITDDMKADEYTGGNPRRTHTCITCGKEYTSPLRNPKPECRSCRDKEQAKRWRLENPEEYRMIQRKKRLARKEKKLANLPINPAGAVT